jgi:hypothetical protein
MPTPSAMNLKFKFPKFVALPDTVVEFAIEEAIQACDSTGWTSDGVQTLAIMYYAAHLLQTSITAAATPTGQLITSERIGELSQSYGGFGGEGAAGYFQSTDEGRKFWQLLTNNFPAVVTVGSAVRMY